jgi:hypothetical protein
MIERDLDDPQRKIVWFSCGAASAIAAKLTVEKKTPDTYVEVVYCNTSEDEHPDNERFTKDVEAWIGLPIQRIGNPKFSKVSDIFQAKKYMSGPAGAPCTVELKKKPRFAFQKADDIHIFGYTKDEKRRVDVFEKNNPELFLEWPLIEAGLTKNDCFKKLEEAGIKLPEMYNLGFNNNNCIGCVKAQSPAYWNKVRQHFPKVFQDRATQSRQLGCKLIKIGKVRSFLDELNPEVTTGGDEDLSCGPQCKFEFPDDFA